MQKKGQWKPNTMHSPCIICILEFRKLAVLEENNHIYYLRCQHPLFYCTYKTHNHERDLIGKCFEQAFE